MSQKKIAGVATVGVLGLVGILMFADTSNVERSRANEPSETIRVVGVVRDFRTSHVDFNAVPAGGFGNHVSILEASLGGDNRPEFRGDGRKVLTAATDSHNRTIAPHLVNETFTCGVTNFQIIEGAVIPGEPFAAMVSVLGSAITTDGDDIPVTTKFRIGPDEHQPFGPFSDAVAGDVNDHTNPRHHIFPVVYPAGTPITAIGRSWDAPGDTLMTVDTDESSPQYAVLRHGDAVPDIEPFEDQGTIESYLHEYIDTSTQTVRIENNQAIFLMELGVTDLDEPAADFQDLVSLLTLARTTDDLVIPDTVVEIPIDLGDHAATLAPSPTDGAIDSQTTFNQWYRDVLGTNLSSGIPITFTRNATGAYVFDDQTDPRYESVGGFFPIDDRLFGNEGQAHNRYFTMALNLRATYDASAMQYFAYTGNCDAWVFINDEIVIDLGGVHDVQTQRIDLDRLCLSDGGRLSMRVFLAHRHGSTSRVRLETNVCFEGTRAPSVSSQYD